MIPYSMDYMRRQLRVCIYARVSTEHEAQISALENQLDGYKPLLKLHPEWILVDQYIDEGITGTSAEKRGEFMRMIEDAKQHKDKVLALANSILESHSRSTEDERKTETVLETKQRELTRLQKRMDNLIEMRADGDLSRELFRTKCAELEPKLQKLQNEIEELTAKQEAKVIVDYTEKLTVLQYALSQYTYPQEGEDIPESVIEAFVEKVVVSKDGFDWYLRFDGDPNKPRRCTLEGKHRTNTKVVVTQDFSPALDSSNTGCYQGLI